jgi:MFS family permease
MKEEVLKKESLKLSIKEGASASVMSGAGNSFITPFALAIGANSLHIGFLSSFIGLVGPLAQLRSTQLMEKFSRKKIIVAGVLIQALIWLPIIFLGFLFYKKIWLDLLPIFLILFYSIQIGIGAIAVPSWFSLMGDLVPEKIRGKYFSKRNKIIGIVSIIAMLSAGLLLDLFKTKGLVLLGFSMIFSISMFARLYSVFLLNKHYDPKITLKKGYYFSFKQFVQQSPKNNFGRFTLFVGFFYFSVFIASPFIAVYMLEQLKFNYIWYTLITLSGSVFSLLFLPFWGRIGDKHGNRLIIFSSSLMISIVPILWMVSPSKIYLILVPSFVSGVFWGAFNLSSFNFIYDSVSPEHRALSATYYHVFLGIGTFAGGIFGGFILRYLSIDSINSFFNFGFANVFLFVFLVSSIVRFGVAFFFLPKIEEVRPLKKPPVLVRELKALDRFEQGVDKFNSSVFAFSMINRKSVKVFNFGNVFK